MLISLVTTLWAFNSADKYRMATVVISVLSLILFTTPVVRAYSAAARLDKDFDAVFNVPSATKVRFSFMQMFTGINTPQLASKTITYFSMSILNTISKAVINKTVNKRRRNLI